MSYQVLARKWRPRNFQQMVGQEHVLRMLTNALDNQRLHHAYLFTGTRGVGKTTLARILAKCLNCEIGISGNPCGQCHICVGIDTGRFLDLIEVDGASRTKVEDTRELLENVPYAPSQGRYKIYLIDEVHMLSGHSFNALLKTLEEPPSHVKFLLATTDPKRLPITVLSRCLQFNLKRVLPEQIATQLETICQAENIEYQMPALQLLAKAADGSMRDALSLLDQTIAYCQNKITTQDTQQMLGSIEQDVLFRLLHALAEHNGAKLLDEIAKLSEFAPDFNQVLEDILTILHQISVAQVIPNSATSDSIQALSSIFSADEVQLYYQIALTGRHDLPLSPSPTQGFEMVMLRMLAFKPIDSSPPCQTPKKFEPKETPQQTIHSAPKTIQKLEDSSDWSTLISRLSLTGLAQSLASNCTLVEMSETKITLMLSKAHEPLYTKKLSDRIEQALSQHLNKPIQLEIKITSDTLQSPAKQKEELRSTRLAHAHDAIKNDQHVKAILDVFGATLDTNSIEAVDLAGV